MSLRSELEAEYFAFKRGLKHRRRAFYSMTARELAGMMLYTAGDGALDDWRREFMKHERFFHVSTLEVFGLIAAALA